MTTHTAADNAAFIDIVTYMHRAKSATVKHGHTARGCHEIDCGPRSSRSAQGYGAGAYPSEPRRGWRLAEAPPERRVLTKKKEEK